MPILNKSLHYPKFFLSRKYNYLAISFNDFYDSTIVHVQQAVFSPLLRVIRLSVGLCTVCCYFSISFMFIKFKFQSKNCNADKLTLVRLSMTGNIVAGKNNGG